MAIGSASDMGESLPARRARSDHAEYLVHQSRGEYDLPVRNGRRPSSRDAMMEAVYKLFHARILVQSPTQYVDRVTPGVAKLLARSVEGWENERKVTLVALPPVPNQASACKIDAQRIYRSQNVQTIQTRFDLRREAEGPARACPIPDEHP